MTKRGSAARAPAADGRDAERAHERSAAAARRRRSRASGTRPGPRSAAVHAAASAGQPPVRRRSCRRGRTSRAGRPARSSQATARLAAHDRGRAGRCWPRRRSPAATLTVRQTSRAGRAAARIDDVVHARRRRRASGARSCSTWRGRRRRARSSGPRPWRALRWSSVTRIGQPPPGAGPASAMSPPRLTSDARAGRRVHAARAAIGGERLGGRAEVDLDAGGDAHGAARAVEPDALPAGGGHDAQARRLAAARDDDGEVAIPAERSQASGRPWDRRRRRCARRRRGRRASASSSSGLAANGAPGRAVEQRELRVVAEAAAGLVDAAQLVLRRSRARPASAVASATVTAAVVPSAAEGCGGAVHARSPRRPRPGPARCAVGWGVAVVAACVVAACGGRGLRRRRLVVGRCSRSRAAAVVQSSAVVVPLWPVAAAARTPKAAVALAATRSRWRRSGAIRGARSRRALRMSVRGCPYRAFEQPYLRPLRIARS